MDPFQMNRLLMDIDLTLTPLEQSDVCKILESLQKNQTLHFLRLSHCKGVEGPDVLAKMMDLVRMHLCLMEINLNGMPLKGKGQAAQVQGQLENNAKDYMAVLRGSLKCRLSLCECSCVAMHTQVTQPFHCH